MVERLPQGSESTPESVSEELFGLREMFGVFEERTVREGFFRKKKLITEWHRKPNTDILPIGEIIESLFNTAAGLVAPVLDPAFMGEIDYEAEDALATLAVMGGGDEAPNSRIVTFKGRLVSQESGGITDILNSPEEIDTQSVSPSFTLRKTDTPYRPIVHSGQSEKDGGVDICVSDGRGGQASLIVVVAPPNEGEDPRVQSIRFRVEGPWGGSEPYIRFYAHTYPAGDQFEREASLLVNKSYAAMRNMYPSRYAEQFLQDPGSVDETASRALGRFAQLCADADRSPEQNRST